MTQVLDRQRWLSGLPPATRRPWWQRILRSPLFWLTIVLISFYVFGLADVYASVNPDKELPDGTVAMGLNDDALRTSAYWAMWTALFYSVLFVWLDRFRAQNPLIWLLVFGWGACASVWISLIINTWAGEMMNTTGADPDAGVRPAIFIAPFVEEASKATVLFLLLILYRNRFIGRFSVVSMAGLSAVGFAFTENIIYYARVVVFATNSIEVADPAKAIEEIVLLRGVYTSFGHPLFTTMTGLGLAVALGARSKWVRVTAPLAGFLLAAGGHMLFNAVASLNPPEASMPQYYIVLGLVIVLALWLVISIFSHAQLIRERLIDFRRSGWLEDRDVIVFSSPFKRIKLHLAGLCRGPKLWWRTARFMRLITELAHTQEQVSRGTVGPGADHRIHELIHLIEELRPHALTDTAGLSIIPPRRQ